VPFKNLQIGFLIYVNSVIEKNNILKILHNSFPNISFNVLVSTCKIIIVINEVKKVFWINDWIHKNSIVLAIINSTIGNNQKFFARNCEVHKIEKKEAEYFLNEHHLLGYLSAYYKYALSYNNEIIAIATFSKGRKMNRLTANKRSFELISFCCKKGVSVVGGLSKLINAFVLELEPGDIMTYVDKDWSQGNAYLKLGFKIHSETAPQVYVFDKINFIKYKNNQIPENISDALQSNNYNFEIVKNSGNIKLVYTL
jgi:hypothetical protein